MNSAPAPIALPEYDYVLTAIYEPWTHKKRGKMALKNKTRGTNKKTTKIDRANNARCR